MISENEYSLNNILIIEDDEGLNRLIRKSLEQEGYAAENAFSGSDALEKIKDSELLLILDYTLPDMTGAQLIEKLSGMDLNPPFIVITGQGDERIAVEMMKMGARDYIIKNWNMPELLPSKIKRVIKEITNERKAADSDHKILIAAEEWRKTFDSISELISVHDKDFRILKANTALADFVGIHPKELIGKKCHDIFHKQNSPIPDCPHLEAYTEKKTVVREFYEPAHNKHFMVTVSPVLDGGEVKGTVHIASDITERVNTSEELKTALAANEDLNKEIMFRLTAVAEFRDTDTGAHISRIGLYAGILAEALGLSSDFTETITSAASLHDIGKVGIKDDILLKPGKLTPEEFNIMKSHTTIGFHMLSDSSHYLLQMAASITLSHHERWDGRGYPKGLKKTDIPIEGRIANICDQYDALMSKRPYKPAFSHEKVVKIITEGDGRTTPEHFDPDVLNAFKENTSVFEEIYNSNQD